MTTDLTVGKPSQKLFWFSIPLLLSVAFQQLYQMADSIIVGRFAETVEAGELALAAVGASYPITQLFVAVATGINIGTGCSSRSCSAQSAICA
ncbi:MAG: MATE family efflux transporter [Butyricicoccus sp.]